MKAALQSNAPSLPMTPETDIASIAVEQCSSTGAPKHINVP